MSNFRKYVFMCIKKFAQNLPKICENRTWYSVHPALHPAPIKTRALPDRTTILLLPEKKKSDFREWIDALRVIDTKNKSEELQEISCLKKWLKPIYILHLTSSLSRRHPALEESFIFLTKQIKDSDTYKLHIMFQSLQSQTVSPQECLQEINEPKSKYLVVKQGARSTYSSFYLSGHKINTWALVKL